MSDLTQFRDHCRRMATKVNQSGELCFLGSDRDLWLMLADEVDLYLERDPEVVQEGTPDHPALFDGA